MKSWRTRTTLGLATVAAAVAIPLAAGTASAAQWHDVAGGPEMYPNLASCQAEIPKAKEHYQDATCVEVNGRVSLWVLY
ncbi:hypothetical protein [Streptomyces sp. NEAU-H3]|uniref:hypothetical protein n=1 Tax=Streptomyces sp. NEAU-H3 TaxID=2720636 RepID=UPI00143A54A5|nr:hypothetical protein [Streptomyces sp. NEAU-H3]NJA56953.1 hypothetical protein [Streptomyces sp. NEAU-H3]